MPERLLALTGASPETVACFREAAQERGHRVVALDAEATNHAELVRRVLELLPDLVFAPVVLLGQLASIPLLPVLPLTPSLADVAAAIIRARKRKASLAHVVHFDATPMPAGELQELCRVPVCIHRPPRSVGGIRQFLQGLKSRGGVVVAGPVVCRLAREVGLEAEEVKLGPVTARTLVAQADAVLAASAAHASGFRMLRDALGRLPVGILLGDGAGRVVLSSPSAAELVDLQDAPALPPHLTRLLARIAQGGKPQLVRIRRSGRVVALLDARPGAAGHWLAAVIGVDRLQKWWAEVGRPVAKPEHRARWSLEDLWAQSPAMRQLMARAQQVAATSEPVLILGEAGTGKEVLAHALHRAGPRGDGPLVIMRCAAGDGTWQVRQLFGDAEEGAGLWDQAQGGTLVLDEVGALREPAQARLVAMMAEMGPVGPSGVPRLVAISRADLTPLVDAGCFLPELFFRLSASVLHVPPLRERREDLPGLLRDLLAAEGARGEEMELSEEALQRLLEHRWPGNVRELANFVRIYLRLRRGMPLLPQSFVEEAALRELRTPGWVEAPKVGDLLVVSVGKLDDMVRQIICQMAERFPGSRTALAKQLGISRTTLWKKLKEAKFEGGQRRERANR